MDEFLCEIAIMKSISRHPNVVALIGYCTVKQPMLMVMEYVGCGDLVIESLINFHKLCVDSCCCLLFAAKLFAKVT